MDLTQLNLHGQDLTVRNVPIGTVLQFTGNTIPSGFYDCTKTSTADFVQLSQSGYSALYSVVGNKYTSLAGSAPSSGNFWIPLLSDAENMFKYIIRVS